MENINKEIIENNEIENSECELGESRCDKIKKCYLGFSNSLEFSLIGIMVFSVILTYLN